MFVLLAFIFQSSVKELREQQFLINCPLPISDGVATLHNVVDGVRLNYTVTHVPRQYASAGYNGTFFECHLDPLTNPPQGANTRIKNYGATLFNTIPYGQGAFYGDTIYAYLDNIQPYITQIYLYATAPQQVTGLDFWNYIDGILIFFLGMGIFLAVKPS